ncbi:MAG: glycosyltransferase family 87 protein [Candidatus Omnitrophota bacterium]
MRRSLKIIILLVICAVFTGNLVRYANRAPQRKYSDFRVYYATGERFLEKKDIYSRPDKKITPFKYSPMFAMLISPLSLLPKHQASLVFFTLNFLSLIGICFVSAKLVGIEELSLRKKIAMFFFSILFTSRFILLVWDSGQVNLIMVFLVLVALYLFENKRAFFGSAFLGLSVMFKYMPAIFLPYLLLRARTGIIILTICFVCIFLALPALYVGVDNQVNYLQKWMPFITKTSLDQSSWYDYKNQSVYSFALRYLSPDSPYGRPVGRLTFQEALLTGIFLAVLIYLLTLQPAANRNDTNLIDYGLLMIGMAIFNPNAWMTNFVVLLFVYIYLLSYLMKENFKDKLTLVLMILAFALSSWAAESVVGDQFENLFEELSSVTIAALLLVFALLRLKFRKPLGRV